MEFKDRVKAVRKAFGLTQKAFAERIGVTRNTISKYEYEGKNPEGPVVALLCREFGVSKTWLLSGEGEMLLPTQDRLIAEMAEKYHLDALDIAIVRLYLRLDADGRAKLRQAAVEVSKAADSAGLLQLFQDKAEPRNVHDWTRDEILAEVRYQLDEEEKGTEEPPTGSPPESVSDCA